MAICSRIDFPEQGAMSEDQLRVRNEIASGPRGGVRGPLRLLLHTPQIAQRVQALGEALRWGTRLSKAIVEVAILLTARRIGADYVWHFHAALVAREELLSSAAIEDLFVGRIPDELSEDDRAIAAFVQELLANDDVGDVRLSDVIRRIGEPGLIELLCLVGYYHIGGYIAAVADLRYSDDV
ncbi:hypothetical protein ACXHXG_15645 [Rhizobium sp. LEGMi198b]|uniref:hypothetical protein n=1 Tax=Rhizobium sp. CNPSo 3464 TaxID=3021406 RepID=UPI002550FD24|nr:hypothetical protein [Rhizobium sp. CNPSo 3464]MDK4742445.1 hypothetical protein [Rhizobium sp. CNPSo 3464]